MSGPTLSHRVYYALKPHLPWSFRMTLRRIIARRIWRRHAAQWPILPSAAQPPEGWSGWPSGKRFAVVLTHDVEGAAGANRVMELAEAERAAGFRSSFNFIPEGSYEVSPGLRAELATRDFEVGVHDLHHDGSLYASRDDFRAHAGRINHYLHAWGASGFRSGFMYHDAEWLHDIDALYDASTFDTDPFEPQPDGANTIFPYWVPRPEDSADEPDRKNQGYVELPYTLAQDSTLFLVLRQPNADLWRTKVDWIARHGGMVLVNVHPDYLYFRPIRSRRETVLSHYRALLDYIATRYAGDYWQPLPRELAAFVKSSRTQLDPVGTP